MTIGQGDLRAFTKIKCIEFKNWYADPSNWGFSPSVNQEFANQFLTDRAAVAASIGKPWMLEETGADVSF